MKRILSLSAAFMLVASVAYAVADPTPDGTVMVKRQVGSKKSVPVRTVVLVRYALQGANSTSLNSGEAVIWDTNSADGVTVTTTTTSADASFAGILATDLKTADATTSTGADGDTFGQNWGWIVVYGLADAEVGGLESAAAGDAFYTSSDATKITAYDPGASEDDSGVDVRFGSAAGGFFMVAPSATNGNTLVFVRVE